MLSKINALKKLVKGEISEVDLTASDILPEQRAQKSKEIYFFSVVADKKYGKGIGGQLLLHAKYEAERNYPLAEKIYATAATTDGEKVLNDSGFTKKQDKAQRKDQHDLYERPLRSR